MKVSPELRAARLERKVLQAADSLVAMAEYQALVVGTREKTERLRAVRLAKLAADEAMPAAIILPAPGRKVFAKSSKRTKEKAARLSG